MSSGTVSGGLSGSVETAPTAATPARRAAPAAAAPVAAPLGTARAKARQSQGWQEAMIEAARLGNTAQLKNLLQQGAALNASDETGRTALIWAVINNQTETVQKLLALGADKALKDHEGLSALQHAKRLNLDRMAALLEASP
jgi:ankyrin repeat protein